MVCTLLISFINVFWNKIVNGVHDGDKKIVSISRRYGLRQYLHRARIQDIGRIRLIAI